MDFLLSFIGISIEKFIHFLFGALVKRSGEKVAGTETVVTDFGAAHLSDDVDNEWLEVGPKNKTAITRDIQEVLRCIAKFHILLEFC